MIGGLIMDKTVKSTKNNKMMAFITVEDLYGSVEVLIFPNRYEQYRHLLQEDSKIFVKGKVSLEEEEDSKLICDYIAPFEKADEIHQTPGRYRRSAAEGVQAAAPKQAPPAQKPSLLWLRFASKEEWEAKQAQVCNLLTADPGGYEVRIFLTAEQLRMRAPSQYNTAASEGTLLRLRQLLGDANVVL